MNLSQMCSPRAKGGLILVLWDMYLKLLTVNMSGEA
jgi:hypothetical protein